MPGRGPSGHHPPHRACAWRLSSLCLPVPLGQLLCSAGAAGRVHGPGSALLSCRKDAVSHPRVGRELCALRSTCVGGDVSPQHVSCSRTWAVRCVCHLPRVHLLRGLVFHPPDPVFPRRTNLSFREYPPWPWGVVRSGCCWCFRLTQDVTCIRVPQRFCCHLGIPASPFRISHMARGAGVTRVPASLCSWASYRIVRRSQATLMGSSPCREAPGAARAPRPCLARGPAAALPGCPPCPRCTFCVVTCAWEVPACEAGTTSCGRTPVPVPPSPVGVTGCRPRPLATHPLVLWPQHVPAVAHVPAIPARARPVSPRTRPAGQRTSGCSRSDACDHQAATVGAPRCNRWLKERVSGVSSMFSRSPRGPRRSRLMWQEASASPRTVLSVWEPTHRHTAPGPLTPQSRLCSLPCRCRRVGAMSPLGSVCANT